MAKKIRIQVTARELGYIAEALEQFLDATPDPDDLAPGLSALHKKMDDLWASVEGEPEEGY